MKETHSPRIVELAFVEWIDSSFLSSHFILSCVLSLVPCALLSPSLQPPYFALHCTTWLRNQFSSPLCGSATWSCRTVSQWHHWRGTGTLTHMPPKVSSLSVKIRSKPSLTPSHDRVDVAAEYYGQRASYPGTLLITEATFVAAKAGSYTVSRSPAFPSFVALLRPWPLSSLDRTLPGSTPKNRLQDGRKLSILVSTSVCLNLCSVSKSDTPVFLQSTRRDHISSYSSGRWAERLTESFSGRRRARTSTPQAISVSREERNLGQWLWRRSR